MWNSKQNEKISTIFAFLIFILLFWWVYVIFGNTSDDNVKLWDSITKSDNENNTSFTKENNNTTVNFSKSWGKLLNEESKNDCLIKWNISDKWEKIYHTPDAPYYSKVTMEPLKWERRFCSEQEAIDAWWRKEEASNYKQHESLQLTKEEQDEYQAFIEEANRDAKREIENMQSDIPSGTDW